MKKLIDCTYTDYPTCPYCGCEYEDWGDLGLDRGVEEEIECAECEKKFTVIGEPTWSFNSYKK